MSRNLMPKSGAMAPYVVVNRDAAVSGVFTVDGEAGSVVLTSKYVQIANYNADKAATAQDIQDLNTAVDANTTAIGAHTTAIQANTTAIHGNTEAIQQANTDIQSNSDAIQQANTDIQSNTDAIQQANTDISGKASKGANSDITELNGLTKAIEIKDGGTGGTTPADARTNLELGSVSIENTVPVDKGGTGVTTQEALWNVVKPTGATRLSADGVDPLDAATVGQLTSAGGAGGYIGQYWHHPSRTHLEGGTIPGDGQVISGASILYPELVAKVVAGELPNTTETTWQSTKGVRASYVYNSDTDTLRVPDYNGVQPGSIPAPVFRGDGGGLAVGSMQKSGVPNLTGAFTRITPSAGPMNVNGVASGIFRRGDREATSPPTFYPAGSSGAGYPLEIDLSLGSDVYQNGLTEVRMNSIVGCIVIRVATAAKNGGDVDMLQLQAQVEELRTAAVATDSKIGYALLTKDTDAGLNNPALDSRVVCVNPFGANTPVICFAEIFHATLQKWMTTPWTYVGGGVGSFGVLASYAEGEGVVLRTASVGYVQGAAKNSGASQELPADYKTPSPMRIHVFSIGKDISKLKQISQIDPALVAEFKAPARPTGIRAVWTRSASETGGVGSSFTLSESILGKVVYFAMQPSGADNWFIPANIPAKSLPAITGSTGNFAGGCTILITTDAAYIRFAISADGKSASIPGSGSAPTILAIYVDDYSVQP